jgi:hypothetical protein
MLIDGVSSPLSLVALHYYLTGGDDDPFFDVLPTPLLYLLSLRPSIYTCLFEAVSLAIDNKICKMPPRQPFNFEFDKEHGEKLLKVVQLYVGCFWCRKPDPGKTCSRCRVSVYCDRDCQKNNGWKTSGDKPGNHKHFCKAYCESRCEENGVNGAIPICLYYNRLIDDQTFELSMRERSDLFLQELHKYQQQQEGELINLFVQLSVVERVDEKISLAATVFFMVDSERKTVKHVLFETVDEGSVVVQRLSPKQGGPGSISTAAAEKVLEHWVAYIGRLHEECNAPVSSITFGRGLVHVADKRSFQASVKAANGGAIMWMPDNRFTLGI